MRIDAHHHLWNRALPAPFDYRWLDAPGNERLKRDFSPTDFEPLIRAARIDAAICVQTQHHVQENVWALELADRHTWMAGVVGWVDLCGPECEAQWLRFREHPKFVGVRHVIQDEPDDFLKRPELLRGLKVLERHGGVFDLLVYERQLPHAVPLAQACPGLTIVLDHLGKPRIRDGAIDDWAVRLRALAVCPNVVCKLSGLATEADPLRWTVDHLRPYYEVALAAFGPSRLLYGGDWPVSTLVGDYQRIHTTAVELTADLSAEERAGIFGENARRVYGLSGA